MTRAYARFYYDDFMREFPEVYADPQLGWGWMQMLVVAEKMWPATPEVPRSIRPRVLARLVDVGLVLPVPPHGYRIRGLDAERTRRQDSARNAARNRWGSADGSATRTAETMPRRDETSRDETKFPPPPAERGLRKDGTNPRARGESPRQVGESPRQIGTSTRQKREQEKRAPIHIGDLLRAAAAAGRPSEGEPA